MDFQNRQYDPQIGRFLSVDPLADDGQEEWSPYAAMGNNPAMMVDPLGLKNYMHDYHSTTTASPVYGGAGRREYNPGRNADEFNEMNAKLAAGAHDLKIRSQFYEISGMFKGVGTGLTAGNDLTSDGGNMAIRSSHTNDTEGTNGGVELVFEGKKKGFFGRVWSSMKKAGNGFLEWAASAFSKGSDVHERGDKTYDKDGGGIMFTGGDGQNEEGRKAGNSDKESESVDDMMFMFGHGGSGGLGNFSENYERFNNFMTSFMGMHDATSQLNNVTKPYLYNDTTDWFRNPNGRTSDLRTIPKDSMKYYHSETYRDSNGYYETSLQLNH